MLSDDTAERGPAMKTIDAYWDTRSLGVRCGQVVFSAGDSADQLSDAMEFARDYDYMVAKLPTTCIDLVPPLEQRGFTFAECSFEVVLRLRDARSSVLMQRVANQMEIKQADSKLKEEIYNQISKGIFDTDRVALDSLFGPQYAAQRYINWIEDELKKDGSLYYVAYKGEGVGFFSYKEPRPGIEAWPFLAGVFRGQGRNGIGSNVALDASRIVAQERGCKRIRTYVSSNNPSILRAQIAYGYQVEKIEYVFVQHKISA